MEPGPHLGLASLGEAAMGRRPGRPETRWQLGPGAPGGRDEHDLAASTSRSPYRCRPPPCGRTGATGTTNWNGSPNSSGISRSTISRPEVYALAQMRCPLSPPRDRTRTLAAVSSPVPSPHSPLAAHWRARTIVESTDTSRSMSPAAPFLGLDLPERPERPQEGAVQGPPAEPRTAGLPGAVTLRDILQDTRPATSTRSRSTPRGIPIWGAPWSPNSAGVARARPTRRPTAHGDVQRRP